jgi:hypothetical protein
MLKKKKSKQQPEHTNKHLLLSNKQTTPLNLLGLSTADIHHNKSEI